MPSITKIQAKRLLNVARALREAAQPKLFSMGKYVWGEENAFQSYTTEPAVLMKEKEFCGTPACALGHFGARRDLQRVMKIQVTSQELEDGSADRTSELVYNDTANLLGGYKVSFDDGYLSEYFGLSDDELEATFGPKGCGEAKTAKAAAKFIERLVKNKRKA